ncbi:T9SS type A sorting domain-containing protein [Mesonia aquimarina]|uniref:T9SS type A sorting domain-containing protein n=1 Tax=Mesonia aquimarina TaxID=1504967 RepID=UPI000EF57D4A|nr:T9SS type A sorting domain-containing protein [Mesonia aquimarina]
MKKFTYLIATSLAMLFFMPVTAQTVTSGLDDGSDGTLRQEITDTPSGGTITFGALVTTVTLNSELIIDKSITIDGGTLVNIVIDADSNGRAFNITSGTVTMNNVDIINGVADDGGAIKLANSTLTISDSNLMDNTANGASGSGGAIYVDAGGTLLVNDSEISNNVANRAGGGIEDNSGAGLNITLNNVNLDNNNAGVAPATAAPGNGGGLHITGAGDAEITGGTVNNNVAAAEGGGLWNGSGSMTVDGTTIDGNTASGAMAAQGGGGIFNEMGTLNIENSAVISNNIADGTSGSGGGILNNQGSLTVTDTEISGNTAVRAGGGIEENSVSGSMLTMTNVDLMDNDAAANPGNGGGLHISGPGDSMITGGTVSGNTASAEGGGLWNGSGSMTVDGTTIDANTASGAMADQGGGGIFNEMGTLSIENSAVISNNIVDGTSGSGGGILNNQGSLTINDSEISGNTAVRAGGGIEENSVSGSMLTMTNVDLLDNDVSANPGNGGGLHISGPGDSMITGGTVSGNTASLEGGGLWNGSGSMTVDGTTIDANTASGAMANEGGGGIFNAEGMLTVQNSAVISNNTADGAAGSGGGILNDMGSLSVSDVEFNSNTAVRAGGAIEENAVDGSMLTISNVDFLGNSASAAPGNGGALHITGNGDAMITGGMAMNNTAAAEGGALWNSVGEMTVDGMQLESNTASGAAADNGGGAIFNNGGTLNVINGTMISSNLATGASGSGGGLLSTDGMVTITDTDFDLNSANRAGGAIEVIDGTLMITTSTMTDNDVNGTAGTAAPGNGGAIHVTGMNTTVTINEATFTGNEAAAEGGALWNQSGSMMNVIMTTVDDNLAAGNGGGGLYNNGGDLYIETSTVSNNQASTMTGGGLLNDSGTTTVLRSTFAGNTSTTDGGAIFNNDQMTLNAVTIANNTATVNGGGISSMTDFQMTNTLVAENTAVSGQDIFGTVSSGDYNLVGNDDASVFTASANDIVGVTPMLGTLQDNGGETFTIELMDGSDGIDSGNPNDTFNDQRNFTLDGTRDIGAFERGGVLGVNDETSITSVKVYPNPSQGRFTIDTGMNSAEDVELKVVSLNGQVVFEEQMNQTKKEISLSGLANGMYILSLTSSQSTTTHKLIIE